MVKAGGSRVWVRVSPHLCREQGWLSGDCVSSYPLSASVRSRLRLPQALAGHIGPCFRHTPTRAPAPPPTAMPRRRPCAYPADAARGAPRVGVGVVGAARAAPRVGVGVGVVGAARGAPRVGVGVGVVGAARAAPRVGVGVGVVGAARAAPRVGVGVGVVGAARGAPVVRARLLEV